MRPKRPMPPMASLNARAALLSLLLLGLLLGIWHLATMGGSAPSSAAASAGRR